MADRISAGALVHVSAPGGHSQLAALDVFYRPGGLAAISPIIDIETSLASGGALRSTAREREPGRGARLVADAQIEPGGVLILVNAFGVNATVIDIALSARERGARIIGLSSLVCEESIPLEHPARWGAATLSSLSHIHVDTKVPPGDATPVGAAATFVPTATSANAFALQSVLLEATAILERDGHAPDVWQSSNQTGGDDRNIELAERYSGRVPAL